MPLNSAPLGAFQDELRSDVGHSDNERKSVAGQNEAFSRVLIDKALEASGWNLLDSQQVQFELNTASGRSDYLLKDRLGRTLCVLEAKREDLDPYDAKEQARGYAENLNAPFVLLSNGREHWFWNYERADQRDAYRIERLPSREDLERLRLKNLQPPRPLQTAAIRPEYLQPPAPGSHPARLPDPGHGRDRKGLRRGGTPEDSCSKWRPAPGRRCCAPR